MTADRVVAKSNKHGRCIVVLQLSYILGKKHATVLMSLVPIVQYHTCPYIHCKLSLGNWKADKLRNTYSLCLYNLVANKTLQWSVWFEE